MKEHTTIHLQGFGPIGPSVLERIAADRAAQEEKQKLPPIGECLIRKNQYRVQLEILHNRDPKEIIARLHSAEFHTQPPITETRDMDNLCMVYTQTVMILPDGSEWARIKERKVGDERLEG